MLLSHDDTSTGPHCPQGIDVLVCTPGRVHELVQEGALSFQSCRIVVLDEVDVLLGDMSEFRELVAPIQASGATEGEVTSCG